MRLTSCAQLILCLFFSFSSKAENPAQLQHPVKFIFERVLALKNQVLRPNIPFPAVRLKSNTPLSEFQDAIEKQWGFRPKEFVNAFAVFSNEVYIMDDADYYRRNQRCMDDSIAHELTHYVQSKYQGWDLNDDGLEADAIDVQTSFRNQYCQIPE